MTDRSQWIWMPHAGHFFGADDCKFRLNTCVGDYIVSTVGEYLPLIYKEFQALGYNKKYEPMTYETMVFESKDINEGCCSKEAVIEKDVETARYNSPKDAYEGHINLCLKWSIVKKTGDDNG
jgi:hypothetical protein